MVRWILERIAAPVRGLHQAAYLLAALTLASQLRALRDRVFAHTFGAGEVLDLYYAAFRVPDLVFARRFIGECLRHHPTCYGNG